MGLSRWERKEKLGHGGVTEIAKKTGRSVAYASEVISGKKRNREIEVATARKLRVKVADAFPEFYGATNGAAT